ncbi:folylpolyglutamate synthase [Skeletonema marinoi]|uniref:tetrahydrofolate synthase n=1 Tax=Skeletonema marinoi TaxID=267567 RepID=A0AAD9DA98_9STRA|nr:folylpolyglutamate synthase [Skeletonema marinoi]
MSTPPAAADFDSAVAALYSQLHQSTTPAALNAAAARRTNTIHDMHTYLHRLGLELNNTAHDDGRSNHHLANPTQQSSCNHTLPPLIIHITGTKGKGSTLSYCESLLRNTYGLTTGMFTSPHLVCIRERIRINGIPVSKKVFAEVYWTVRRMLERNCHVMLQQQQHSNDATADVDDGNSSQGSDQELLLPPLPTLPGYFRMLTLMALYTFAHHDGPKVDAILLEVGMGGRYDATNVFEPHNDNNNRRILVRGITLIDFDHTRVLGSTLEQIAWEKGGIFVSNKRGKIHGNDGGYDKFLIGHEEQQEEEEYEDEERIGYNNTLYVNGSNTPQVANVLRTIAREEKDSSLLQLVQDSYLDSIPELNFHATHQRGNAALALAICQHAILQYQMQQQQQHCYYRTTLSNNGNVTKEQISAALNNTFWPGRCHTLTLPSSDNDNQEVSLKLRCDGAHTPISINACINWFQSILTSYSETTSDSVHKVLIFNCGHERNPIPLLHTLHQSGLFDRVYFSRADFERPSAMPKQLLDEWRKEEILTIVEPMSGEECATVNYEVMCNTLNELGMTTSSDAAECDGMTKRTWQHTLASIWKVIDLYHSSQVVEKKSHPSTNVDSKKVVVGLKVVDAIEDIKKHQQEALREVNGGKASVEILVTGSLYLVGSALEAVGWEEGESEGRLSIH